MQAIAKQYPSTGDLAHEVESTGVPLVRSGLAEALTRARAARVRRLRRQIAAGEYRVDAARVAAAMLERHRPSIIARRGVGR